MSGFRAASRFALGMAFGLLTAAAQASAPSGSKDSSTHAASSPAAVEVINGTVREIKTFEAAPASRPARHARSAPAATRVEVINGASQRTVVLAPPTRAAETQRTAQRKAYRRHGNAAAPRTPQVTAEILNGTVRSTEVFPTPGEASGARPSSSPRSRQAVVVGVASSGSEGAGESARPVVIGIAASGTRTSGGTDKPVVVRVASSGSESESGSSQPVVVGIESNGIAQAGADVAPVAIGVSPHPSKRPPYRRPAPSP